MQLVHSPSVHTELPFRVPAAHALSSCVLLPLAFLSCPLLPPFALHPESSPSHHLLSIDQRSMACNQPVRIPERQLSSQLSCTQCTRELNVHTRSPLFHARSRIGAATIPRQGLTCSIFAAYFAVFCCCLLL